MRHAVFRAWGACIQPYVPWPHGPRYGPGGSPLRPEFISGFCAKSSAYPRVAAFAALRSGRRWKIFLDRIPIWLCPNTGSSAAWLSARTQSNHRYHPFFLLFTLPAGKGLRLCADPLPAGNPFLAFPSPTRLFMLQGHRCSLLLPRCGFNYRLLL